MITAWFAVLIGCVKPGVTPTGESQSAVLDVSAPLLVELSKHPDSEVRAAAFAALIDVSSGSTRAEWATKATQSEDAIVLERVYDRLLVHREGPLLDSLTVNLIGSDQLRCELALKRFWLDGDRQVGRWPVSSEDGAEARTLCALAAAELLTVYSPLEKIAKHGNIAYSKRFLLLLARSDAAIGEILLPELDWLELEYARQLQAAIAVSVPEARPNFDGMGAEDCWDLIDVLENIEADQRRSILGPLKGRADSCGQAARLLDSGGGSEFLSVMNNTKDPDLLALAVREVEHLAAAGALSSRQQRARVKHLIAQSESPLNELRAIAVRGLSACPERAAGRQLRELDKRGEEFLTTMQIELQRGMLVHQQLSSQSKDESNAHTN